MSEEENLTPCFIADAMLGKLARWLRVLGYDTLYLQGDDHVIAARTRAEGRILLTRDTELSRRKGLSVILIKSQVLQEQLTQVMHHVTPPLQQRPSRCMKCNGSLTILSPEQARSLVPPYVAQTQNIFHQCKICGQMYWRGTHWQNILMVRDPVVNRIQGE